MLFIIENAYFFQEALIDGLLFFFLFLAAAVCLSALFAHVGRVYYFFKELLFTLPI